MTKGQRDVSIMAALMSYGFTLNEIGGYVGIHYASADNVVTEAAPGKK